MTSESARLSAPTPAPRGWARSALLADLALACGVGAFAAVTGSVHHRGGTEPVAVTVGWNLALAAPLLLCRRWPGPAVALVGVVAFLQWWDGVPRFGDVAVLVSLFALGLRERRTWPLLVLLGGAELGVVLTLVRWAPDNPWVTGVMLTGTVTAAWVLGVYSRTRRAYVESITERAESAERDRDARAQIAVATERARIAREMHDVVAHSVSVMITLNDAAAAVGPPGQQRDAIVQASEVGRQALEDMHRMLGVLRAGGEHAPQPGVTELAALVATVDATGPKVDLAVRGDLDSVGEAAQLTVYRIVQECLTNVLKHARLARQVSVDVSRGAGRVDITVQNDGAVARGPGRQRVGGHGLAGMRERAELFDGRVVAGPRPEGGWRTTATLVVAGPEAAR